MIGSESLLLPEIEINPQLNSELRWSELENMKWTFYPCSILISLKSLKVTSLPTMELYQVHRH